ncbi:hypothetical protein SEA_KATE_43 [Microbacterium phage Kate]|nr:hypothetical protein SEA_NEPTUNE_42 [Microbacterium phage Neptune]UDL15521.1 hypothetical protein SEA_CYBELE_42 [Microbacterium phage Cybele]URP21709.1 hypothetical protein SEA_KATE_43 [Microbacterium phage Kate]
MVARKTAEAAKSTVKTDAAKRRVAKKGEPPRANYAEKAVPSVIQNFAEYLTEQTGYEVDLRSVYLGSALRGEFQKSPENQKRIADRAAEIEREREERAAKAEERAAAKAEREAAAKAKAEEKAAAAKEAKSAPKTAAAKAPAKTAAKKAPAKTAAAKAAPATTRRRPARPAASKGEDF